jgi:hypothetical protein
MNIRAWLCIAGIVCGIVGMGSALFTHNTEAFLASAGSSIWALNCFVRELTI